MPVTLRYGTDSQLDDCWPSGLELLDHSRPTGTETTDVASALRSALDSPVDGLKLGDAVVPGDSVTIALDPAVPHADVLLAGIVEELTAHGIRSADITILIAAGAHAAIEDLTRLVPHEGESAVTVIEHRPGEVDEHGYLASTKQGERVYLHRSLLDADFVLPLGCVRFDPVLGYHAGASTLYPQFSGEETQKRFRRATPGDSSGEEASRLWAEIDEVSWLLGSMLAVQVLPGGTNEAGTTVLNVWLSTLEAARERGRQALDAAWRIPLFRPVPIVVAAIDGPPELQTWSNLGRVLSAVERVVEPGGQIVLCCDLGIRAQDIEPEGAVARLTDDTIQPSRRPATTDDAWVASRLAALRQKAHVYLLSQLNPSFVEDLSLAPVHDEHEIENLLASAGEGPCLVLGSAHYALPEVSGSGDG